MSKKKQPNQEKQQRRYSRILVIEAVAGRIYSYREDFEKLLRQNNMAGYITDDWKTNAESVFNILLAKAGTEKEISSMLGTLFHYILEVPLSKDKRAIWDKVAEQMKLFKKQVTVSQYFAIVRQILIKTIYGAYFSPLWLALDYEYCQDGIFVGETDKHPLKIVPYFEIDRIGLGLPFYYISSMADYGKENSGYTDMLKAMKSYIDSKGVSKYDYVKIFSEPQAVPYTRAITNYCDSNSALNKFMFKCFTNSVASSLDEYVQVVQIAVESKIGRNIEIGLNNLFYKFPFDIFKKRKYIFLDTMFPKLSLPIYDAEILNGEGKGNQVTICIENVHIFERNVKRPEQDYYMIFMEYSIWGTTRIIPICIDNMMATADSFNIIDKHAFILLLGLYGFTDEISSLQIEEDLEPIFEGAMNIVKELEYVGAEQNSQETHNKPKGSHQTKEVYVDAFVRRLPAGQKPSEQAKELAKQYRVELGEDHTIVSSYVRNKPKSI